MAQDRQWDGRTQLGAIALIAAAIVALVWLLGPSGTNTSEDGSATSSTAGSTALAQAPDDAFILTPDASREPTAISTAIGELQFATFTLPANVPYLRPVVATSHGFAALSGSWLYWSTDGIEWRGVELDAPPTPSRLAVAGDGLVVYGSSAVRLRWGGSGWVDPEPIPGAGGFDDMTFGPRGAVAVAATTLRRSGDNFQVGPQVIISYSPDGRTFAESSRAPTADPEPVAVDEYAGGCRPWGWSSDALLTRSTLATADGFVFIAPAFADDWDRHPLCEPRLWFSANGDAWTTPSDEPPFGDGAHVAAVAQREGRFVAVGGITTDRAERSEGAVWVSDNGLEWSRVDLDPGIEPTVGAGPRGWMILGGQPASGDRVFDVFLWTSTDGITWDGPHALPDGIAPGWLRDGPVVGSEAVLGAGFPLDSVVGSFVD